MQADNDNLDRSVKGFENWDALHEAAQRVVEACTRERAASHQVDRSHREVSATGGAKVGGELAGAVKLPASPYTLVPQERRRNSVGIEEDGRADHARLSGSESVGSTSLRFAK